MALTETIKSYVDASLVGGTVKQKYVDISGTGVHELIAAVADKQIQILEFIIGGDTAGNYALRSGTNAIFTFPLSTTSVPFELSSHSERPIFCGNVGENINVNITPNPTVASVYVQWRER